MGFPTTVITPDFDTLPSQEWVSGIRVLRFPGGWLHKSGLHHLWSWLVHHRELFTEAALVHAHDFSPLLFWYALPSLLLPRRPAFVTYHGFEGYPIPARYRQYRKIVDRLVRGRISIGHFIPTWYGTQPGTILYGGIDPADFAGEAEPGNGPFVFVGRLEPDTGVTWVVEAYAQLAERRADVPELVICGDGSLRSVIQPMTERFRIRLAGMVSHPQDYSRRATAVIATGYLALLEALAQGRPVISYYQNPLKRDYLTAFPSPPGTVALAASVPELAACMESVLDTAPPSARLAEGRAWARTQTWEAVAQAYCRLWEGCLS